MKDSGDRETESELNVNVRFMKYKKNFTRTKTLKGEVLRSFACFSVTSHSSRFT